VKVGDDDFVGLVGQDKNRMHDSLDARHTDLSEEAGHHKVTTSYFLTSKERDLFTQLHWPLQWPVILFSVGTEEKGAALAKHTTRKLHRESAMAEVSCPCIVLTGLGYTKLMDTEADKALGALREIIIEAPPEYRKSVPLTYDRVPDLDQKLQAEEMDVHH
jgi:hypothetical protein